jgi:hypothetical protein
MNIRTFLHFILRFLFRRIDFLSKSFYIIILAIVRELSAIGFSEGVVDLAKEIKLNPVIHGWKYWSIRVLEVLLIGGNWLILIILILILVGIGFLKYRTKNFPSIKHHFNSQLRTIENLVNEFKSATSLTLLNKILEDIDDSYLEEKDKNELRAWAHYLLGLRRVEDNHPKASFLNLIESHKLDPNNRRYKERACMAYYRTDQKEKALVLAKELLEADNLSERGFVVRIFTDPAFNLTMIPSAVKEGMDFKRLYANHILSSDQAEREMRAKEVIKKELENKIVPDAITFSNADFWDLIGRFAFYLGTLDQPNNFPNKKESYANNQLVNYSNEILSKIYKTVSSTEAFRDLKAFSLTAYYYFYSDYLLNGTSESISEMTKFHKDILLNKELGREFSPNLLICLNQLQRYDDVLALTPSLRNGSPFIYLMEFYALNGLARKEEAIKSYLEYLKLLDKIGDIEVYNLLSFGDFLIQEKREVVNFYNEYIRDKLFEESLYRDIVFCYYHRYDSDSFNTIVGKIEFLANKYKELVSELQYVLLIIIIAGKKFELAISLIEEFHDWQKEQLPLHIYTESLLGIRNDSIKLLRVLKFRRTNFPNEYLFIQEITIYELSENQFEILQVSNHARIKFPTNPNFDFYYIFALYKLNKEDELKDQLNEGLFQKNFSWNQKFLLSRICIEKGKKLLGLELFYLETIKNGATSPMLKQSYFTLMTMIVDRDDIPWPETVELNTVVSINANQETIFKTVDESSLKEDWLIKPILGQRKDAVINIDDPTTHKRIQVTILNILDKYSGLAAKIVDEIDKSNFTGMGIRSVKFENSTVDGISKALIEAFGEEGDKNKIRRDEAFSQYDLGNISFTELVRRASRDKALQIYSYLTSIQSKGFRVIPIRDFNNVQINEDTEFVIDFTSFPILMKISEDSNISLKHKFIISQFAIELIEQELSEAKSMQGEGITLSITTLGVRPALHPPGHKEYLVSTLEHILGWINKNCETRVSNNKLDMILQRPDLIKEGDLYYNYLMDTIFISCNRTLISDDRIHNFNFQSHYLTISLEYYLQFFYKDIFRQNILPVLIQNHYIGIKLDCESIKNEFKKPFYGGVNTFHYCLENLPFSVNHDLTVFNESLDFIKFIYTEQMPLEFKKETSQKVLVHALKNYPDFLGLKRNLINEIKVRFSLLQLYLPEVLQDFTVAFDILHQSNNSIV